MQFNPKMIFNAFYIYDVFLLNNHLQSISVVKSLSLNFYYIIIFNVFQL